MKQLIVLVCALGVWKAFSSTTLKERYLGLMETAVGAYTSERTADYVARVEKDMVKEHGFPRLTANIGILVAQGRLPDKKDLFKHMMDLCCRQMPIALPKNGGAVGNDFGIKEIVSCLLEVEKAGVFSKSVTDGWRADLATAVPETTYTCRPPVGDKTARNWCVFAAASEQARTFAGVNGSPAFTERYLGDQLRFFDANGMYKDPNQPMVYDFVTRLQYAVALHFGYEGPSRPALEALLLKSAEPTLLMLSASGEIPFGGRSNQFLHNETFYAALCEWYASWFKRRGDLATASRFRAAAKRAVDALDYWIAQTPLRHTKNRYPLETRYGCEGYGYFDKYMVTMGSWAYLAYLFADESIPVASDETQASVFTMGPDFHRSLMNAGGYTVEFDLNAQKGYDANGLGRVQRRGAPPMICLSVPFPVKSHYTMDVTNRTPLAILPGWKADGNWVYGYDSVYTITETKATNDHATTTLSVARKGVAPLTWKNRLSSDGLEMTLVGTGDLALALPVFDFDGETKTEITESAHGISVFFHGWSCRYETEGTIIDTGTIYGNRNGHYRRYEARGKGRLMVRIRIKRADTKEAELQELCDRGWAQAMTTWQPKTGLVYGCAPEKVRSSADCVSNLFHWVQGMQDGYGANVSDCALICGTALSGLVDKWAVLKDDETKEVAAKVARGVLNLAVLHGYKGFVARGICLDDGKSCCDLSSRDQYTHWVHGLWRYAESGMAEPALLAEYKRLIVEVASFMEEKIVETNGWNFGLAGGGKDPRGICTMWGPEVWPHEAARLPMIYIAAYRATGEKHWLDLYEKYIDEAIDRTLVVKSMDPKKIIGRMPCYSLFQANTSFEPILVHEGDSTRTVRIHEAMCAFADLAQARQEWARVDYARRKLYGMCWEGELLLTQLMSAPWRPFSECSQVFLDETICQHGLMCSNVCHVAHMMSAYWRWRWLKRKNMIY